MKNVRELLTKRKLSEEFITQYKILLGALFYLSVQCGRQQIGNND